MRGKNKKYTLEEGVNSGVGVRQGQMDMFQEGGRYLDNCTDFKVELRAPVCEKTARFFEDIRGMKLPPIWKAAAEILDPDLFLELWQLLDSHIDTTDDRRLYVPKFGTYEKHQRNLMIHSMKDIGVKSSEIQKRLRSSGHYLSARSIERILQE